MSSQSPRTMLDNVPGVFYENHSLRQLLELIDADTRNIFASGVRGSATAFLLSLLFEKLKRTVLVIASSHQEALEFYNELAFYRGTADGAEQYATPDSIFFPPLETHPYEHLSTHPAVSGQRTWALHQICTAVQPSVIITCIQALLQKVVPRNILLRASRRVCINDDIDREGLCQSLIACGYTRVSLVEDRGDVSIRGDVMDIFPPGYPKPLRISFFGDTVESIRLFDQVTQRSCGEKSEALIIPVKEALLTAGSLEEFRKKVQHPSLKKMLSETRGKAFYENIESGFFPAGIEYSLSLIYPGLETLFHYLPAGACAAWTDASSTEKEKAAFRDEVDTHYLAALDEKRMVSPVEELFIDEPQLQELTGSLQHVFFERLEVERPQEAQVVFAIQSNEDIRREMIHFDSPQGALAPLADKMEAWLDEGNRIFLICHTAGQGERLRDVFHDYGFESRILQGVQTAGDLLAAQPGLLTVRIGKLSRGFRFLPGQLMVITEEEIFGEKRRRPAVSRFKDGIELASFSDLQEGNLIVHRDHGIGRYRGLATLEVGNIRGDYLALEYLGRDKLYLPVDRINLIQKYDGAEEIIPRIDKLGGISWGKTKNRVKDAIQKMARDLLELYSARKVYQGHAFPPPDHYYREFEAAFPYEETPDQLAAIEDVMQDMTDIKPMDRLVCGDVGYGKTEVALRASFRSVMEGKQVAVLVPTTVLAQQHYQTFIERFSPYPVRVEILSRFRSARDQKRIIEALASGVVDIIIGTHRLLQKDVVFRDIGLLVIDEEHRFGVKAKEVLKKLRSTVDVLTLTATPIPRTLQLSLLGIRDFSVINTPPQDRLSIRTTISRFDENVIREALVQELRRGGQIFFVHDRVRSIPAMALFLRKLVPEARLGIAHGQMKAHELEEAMIQFIKKEIDLLLCTTIIESGLDFPAANTIIINRADKLGLAQMYQLRGRVGRGKLRAYACLLIPGEATVSQDAARRLEALTEFTELGSGYRLAARDLQIRGAGNILGHAQSGQIAAVGLDMYLQLLEESIHELKGEKVPPRIEPAVNLPVQAYIPEDY
ncbi:MAG: transcription-repair coupling factor, partial [Proteobacteria bacterium]|nr:transcription-repair coupling factor [Pseudomonadota bacterium]